MTRFALLQQPGTLHTSRSVNCSSSSGSPPWSWRRHGTTTIYCPKSNKSFWWSFMPDTTGWTVTCTDSWSWFGERQPRRAVKVLEFSARAEYELCSQLTSPNYSFAWLWLKLNTVRWLLYPQPHARHNRLNCHLHWQLKLVPSPTCPSGPEDHATDQTLQRCPPPSFPPQGSMRRCVIRQHLDNNQTLQLQARAGQDQYIYHPSCPDCWEAPALLYTMLHLHTFTLYRNASKGRT